MNAPLHRKALVEILQAQTRPAAAMPGRALMLSWRHRHADQRDADLFRIYTRMRPAVNVRARMMLLSGLAGFQHFTKGMQ